MVPQKQILASFVTDAIRLTGQAEECVKQLSEQVAQNRVSPASVRSLFQILHTLKGTASMVPGAEKVADSLHRIEGLLACQTVVESAQSPSWVPLADESVREARSLLEKLQRKERGRNTSATPEPLVKGLLVATGVGGARTLLWFPLTCLTKVLMPEEIAGGAVLCVEGAWVPVIGVENRKSTQPYLGLGIRSRSGSAVIVIDDVLAICGWGQAAKTGAGAGLDIFMEMATELRAA